jgi:hypothetical protein
MFDWQIYPTATPPSGIHIVVWRSNGHRIVAQYDDKYWRWDTGDGHIELRALNGDHWSLIPPLPTQEAK